MKEDIVRDSGERMRVWVRIVVVCMVAGVGCSKRISSPVDNNKQVCDAGTGWQEYGGNPAFRSDPTLADGLPGDPSVVAVRGSFILYYGATRGDFSEPSKVQIFRATSSDGMTWERTSTPVLTPGAPGSWDALKVETPSVLRRPDGSWAMYYSGNDADSEVDFEIGLATSSNGTTWQRYGAAPVLRTNGDELSLIGPSVLYDGERYLMFYAAIDTTNHIDIRLATSADGIVWTREGPVLQMDNVERTRMDDFGVKGPEVIKTDRGFEMVYNSLLAPRASSGAIYYANSSDGRSWMKHPKPLLRPSGGDAFDATEVGPQTWLKTECAYLLWYVGTHTDYTSFFEGGFGLLKRPCDCGAQ